MAGAAAIPLGSIVSLTIDNGDGGRGIIVNVDNEGKTPVYKVLRFGEEFSILVFPYEISVEWMPRYHQK